MDRGRWEFGLGDRGTNGGTLEGGPVPVFTPAVRLFSAEVQSPYSTLPWSICLCFCDCPGSRSPHPASLRSQCRRRIDA